MRFFAGAQNDNIIVVVFNEMKRFFAALRMTKKGAQNDKKKMLRMTPKLLIVILNGVKDLDFDG